MRINLPTRLIFLKCYLHEFPTQKFLHWSWLPTLNKSKPYWSIVHRLPYFSSNLLFQADGSKSWHEPSTLIKSTYWYLPVFVSLQHPQCFSLPSKPTQILFLQSTIQILLWSDSTLLRAFKSTSQLLILICCYYLLQINCKFLRGNLYFYHWI